MWSIAFWKETADRAIKSAAQAILLGLGLGEGLNAFTVDWKLALGFAIGGAILSLLTSIASSKIGEKGTVSLIQ